MAASPEDALQAFESTSALQRMDMAQIDRLYHAVDSGWMSRHPWAADMFRGSIDENVQHIGRVVDDVYDYMYRHEVEKVSLDDPLLANRREDFLKDISEHRLRWVYDGPDQQLLDEQTGVVPEDVVEDAYRTNPQEASLPEPIEESEMVHDMVPEEQQRRTAHIRGFVAGVLLAPFYTATELANGSKSIIEDWMDLFGLKTPGMAVSMVAGIFAGMAHGLTKGVERLTTNVLGIEISDEVPSKKEQRAPAPTPKSKTPAEIQREANKRSNRSGEVATDSQGDVEQSLQV